MTSTIFAVSSGTPPAAIAVLRISGPAAYDVVQKIAGTLPQPRTVALRAIRDPDTRELLDRGLVMHFPRPNTATGEDLVELHLHGGRAVVAAIEQVLDRQPGLRRAEAGEFTRRALAAGRIDLAEAEGLGDLLLAETQDQRRAAMAAVEGSVGRAVLIWQTGLLALSARVEALLDFSDEDDVETEPIEVLSNDAAQLAQDMELVLGNPPVERLRDGIHVVLAGAPNAGKSTLLNTLSGRDAAIVSPVAGTTRDRIEVPVVREGIAYVLIDTAGLADGSADPIELIGIDRTRSAMASADIVLLLDDTPAPAGVATVRIYPQCDRNEPPPRATGLKVSAVTGDGIEMLWGAIGREARALLPRMDRLILNRRQRALCAEAAAVLAAAAGMSDLVLIAEQLRLARLALDRITGASDTDAMLDALFGQFCIGK